MIAWLIILSICLVMFVSFEFNYFIRSLFCTIVSRIFKKKRHILDQTSVTGFCLLNDVDYFLDHMNNARYIRELDFAKQDFYLTTGLFKKLKSGSIFVSATTIRYRRMIKTFTKFQIKTQIIYWDNQHMYMEHKFVTKGGFINAIALSRIRLTNVDVDVEMKKLIGVVPTKNSDIELTKKVKPSVSDELQMWIESNQISSKKLRENDKVETV